MKADGRISEGIQRGSQFEILVDGRSILAYEGETIVAALMASGIRTLRHTAKHDAPRGIFCGMGICFDCTMTVNGVPNVRGCVTQAQPGMVVEVPRESVWRTDR